MAFKELTGFLGVNLRRDRLSLEDFELARAVNADLSSILGTIRIAPGRRPQFETALADLVVRRLARIAARRYRIAGRSVYRNQTLVLSGNLSPNERTTIVPFRPLLDNLVWAFIADDGVMTKDDGTNLYVWGIVAPLSTPTVALGVGSGLAGEYSYRYTYARVTSEGKLGHESNPSSPSEALIPSDQNIGVGNLLHPIDPQVTHIGVFRTVDEGSRHFLEARRKVLLEHNWSFTHLFEVTAIGSAELAQHFTQDGFFAASASPTSGEPKFPQAAVNQTGVGTKAWQNPTNVKSSNDTYARADATADKVSNYLKATKFGFAIATGTTIAGIQVEVERKAKGSGTITDNQVRIVKAGTIGATDRSNTDPWPTAEAFQAYGGNTDLWGETWTAEDLNADNFGVALSITLDYGGGAKIEALVDSIRVTVFTTGAPATSRPMRVTHSWEPGGSHDSIDNRGRRVTHRWELTDGYVTTQVLIWAFSSELADLSLGAEVQLDNDPPIKADFAVSHQEHIFLLGDDINPHYLYWSKRFQPEAFRPLDFVEIGEASDPLQGMVSLGGLLGVFSRKTKYRILGNDASGFVHQESLSRRGTRSPYSIIATEKGVAFVSDDGAYSTNLVGEDEKFSAEIEPLFNNLTVNDYEPITQGHADRISTAFFKNRIYMSYPSGGRANPDMLAVFSLDTQKWYFWDMAIASLFVEEDDGVLSAGGLDGFAYFLEDGLTDMGNSITMTIETKDIVGESPNVRKLWKAFRLDANADGDTLTVEPFVDGRSLGTYSITGNREKLIRRLAATFGYSARLKITYTGKRRPTIHGALLEYELLQATP